MYYEIRRYQARPGFREEWVRYMEAVVIPFQVSLGMDVTASFVDTQDENGYVWIRRFGDEARSEALYAAVYEHDRWKSEIGPVVHGLLIPEKTVVTRVAPTPASPLQRPGSAWLLRPPHSTVQRQRNPMSTRILRTSAPASSVTRAAAGALIAAVHVAAARIGFTAAVAVTDQGGHLKAFDRAGDAPFLTAEVALDKAWTAAAFLLPTHTWNDYLADSRVAPLAGHPRLTAVAGGYPIIADVRCIGGLGISGGSYEQDQQAAEEALAALGFELPGQLPNHRSAGPPTTAVDRPDQRPTVSRGV
ncbi:heme-binding protein [Streptomyces sp. NBC_01180]|uniref:heme-binding protein n=1 Tax=Streptomyces sp. NBC_01180 TaxID=2903763 RepID=UPI00386DF336|nr:heme-binding protein [Streptomyces sp. NBC_01180]